MIAITDTQNPHCLVRFEESVGGVSSEQKEYRIPHCMARLSGPARGDERIVNGNPV